MIEPSRMITSLSGAARLPNPEDDATAAKLNDLALATTGTAMGVSTPAVGHLASTCAIDASTRDCGSSHANSVLRHLAVGLATVAIAVGLYGCGTYPSRVALPDSHSVKDGDYAPDLSKISKDLGIYPLETDHKKVLDQASLYVGTWRGASRELLTERDTASNLQFASMIAAAYQAVRGNTRSAKWYVAGAGGLGLLQDRYHIEAHALLYRHAADAMQCLRTAIATVPEPLWIAYDEKTGDFRLSTAETTSVLDEDGTQAADVLSILFRTINGKMTEIVRRLVEGMESDKVVVPSASEITAAVTKDMQTQPKADRGAVNLKLSINDTLASVDRLRVESRARRATTTTAFNLPQTWSPLLRDADDSSRLMALQTLNDVNRISKNAMKLAIALPDAMEVCVSKVGNP
jgi:hypothetical protein